MNDKIDNKLTKQDLELIAELIEKIDPDNKTFYNTKEIVKVRKKMISNFDSEINDEMPSNSVKK